MGYLITCQARGLEISFLPLGAVDMSTLEARMEGSMGGVERGEFDNSLLCFFATQKPRPPDFLKIEVIGSSTRRH